MSVPRSRYETDFYDWTREQAAAIRAGVAVRTNLPIDWENVAEEIESLGSAQRRELASRIATVIEHLLKLDVSPAEAPRHAWVETVLRSRAEIVRLLRDSPSLRREVPGLIASETPDTARLVAALLDEYGEATPGVRARLDTAHFTPEQVLGDWLPDPHGG